MASCVVALTGLTACQTTQETAALKAIDSARQRADDFPVVVKQQNPDVTITSTDLIRSKAGSAVVVVFRNDGAKAVNDLPISVGVVDKGKRMLLNKRPGSYYKNHAPAIGPGEDGTWVFTTDDPLKKARKPFALIGLPPKNPPTVAETVPILEVSRAGFTRSNGGAEVKALISNTTGGPQYGLTVYAWARQGGRIVAAGNSGATDLSTDDSDTVKIDLVGEADPASIELSAPATIFD